MNQSKLFEGTSTPKEKARNERASSELHALTTLDHNRLQQRAVNRFKSSLAALVSVEILDKSVALALLKMVEVS